MKQKNQNETAIATDLVIALIRSIDVIILIFYYTHLKHYHSILCSLCNAYFLGVNWVKIYANRLKKPASNVNGSNLIENFMLRITYPSIDKYSTNMMRTYRLYISVSNIVVVVYFHAFIRYVHSNPRSL